MLANKHLYAYLDLLVALYHDSEREAAYALLNILHRYDATGTRNEPCTMKTPCQ